MITLDEIIRLIPILRANDIRSFKHDCIEIVFDNYKPVYDTAINGKVAANDRFETGPIPTQERGLDGNTTRVNDVRISDIEFVLNPPADLVNPPFVPEDAGVGIGVDDSDGKE